jgi:hypothetical protein
MALDKGLVFALFNCNCPGLMFLSPKNLAKALDAMVWILENYPVMQEVALGFHEPARTANSMGFGKTFGPRSLFNTGENRPAFPPAAAIYNEHPFKLNVIDEFAGRIGCKLDDQTDCTVTSAGAWLEAIDALSDHHFFPGGVVQKRVTVFEIAHFQLELAAYRAMQSEKTHELVTARILAAEQAMRSTVETGKSAAALPAPGPDVARAAVVVASAEEVATGGAQERQRCRLSKFEENKQDASAAVAGVHEESPTLSPHLLSSCLE